MTFNTETSATIPLGQLPRGLNAKVSHFIKSDEKTDDLLRELGFSEGLDVSVLHESPFGSDPIAISIGQMTVALRRNVANFVMVTPV